MQHVAIDLGSRESQICIRDATGEILLERKLQTQKLPSFLSKQPHSRVIVETSAEAFLIADAALEHGHEVRVVPATLVKTLGVGERRQKSDQRDARKLSEVSTRIDLPSVHVPSESSRQRKALCNTRKNLIEARTKLTNYVRGQLRLQALVVPGRASSNAFPSNVRQALLAHTDGMPVHLDRVLQTVEVLNEQLDALDEELLAVAKQDSVCQRLMTVPGVGPVIAVRFVAVVDQPERFPSAHHLMSYLGLTPGENSSSMRVQRTGITKAGATDLRAVLVQGAWSILRHRRTTDPMGIWANALAERRNRFIAVTALARKLVGILWAIWTQGTTYRALHSAASNSEREAASM
jgi:transposase